MVYNVKRKVVLVTGGANGIGAAVVQEFLTAGAKHVAFLDLDETRGVVYENELKCKFGRSVATFYKCDVTNEEEFFDVFDAVVEKFGYLDVVVNNAGITDDSMYRKQIEINVTGVISGTVKALEIMSKDKGGKGGTIINISSVAALQQLAPMAFVYFATKAAVLHFSNCVGLEPYYSRTNVRVITMCFGITDTAIIPQMVSFDESINDDIQTIMNSFEKMKTDVTAKGVVEAFRKGESASTWLVNNNKISDISEFVRRGYETFKESLAQ